jgi:DNA-binding CsgD family transcriptional regulator
MEPRLVNIAQWEVSNVTDGITAPVVASFGEKYKLTPREREVVQLLVVFGFRNDDLSRILYISSKTVKNHLACLMQKTNTRSSRELQALFLRTVLETYHPALNR